MNEFLIYICNTKCNRTLEQRNDLNHRKASDLKDLNNRKDVKK